MSKMIFVNLPVTDIAAATRFYEALGCSKNAQFSDENAASMMWSDTITFQLLQREYFATFTPKRVVDAREGTEVLLALTADARTNVDSLVETAAAAGGKADIRAALDFGFMYNRTVEDPDGHVLEIVWMDATAVAQMDDKNEI